MNIESTLAESQRLESTPCSDYINNTTQTMSEETPCTNEPSLETKAIETWIQNDVKVNYTLGADIATGNQDYVSDATDSPKRGDSAFFNVDSETDEHDHANGSIPRMSDVSDVYERQLLEEAKKFEERKKEMTRFSVKEIFDNPALESAAKQELQERPPLESSVSNADSVISLPESRISQFEQTVYNSENLDRDAERDVHSGQSEIQSLLDRLELGKTATTSLLKFVSKLHQAELSYAASLLSVSRMNVANIGHTDGFRYASECLSELPMAVRSAHSKIGQSLAEAESSLTGVIQKIKVLIDSLMHEGSTLTAHVRSKRSALSKSKSRHQVSFKQMESIAETRLTSSRSLNDPWLTEGQVAHDYTQLISGQVNLKKALTRAYERATEVEHLRLQTAKAVITTLIQCYGTAIEENVVPFVVDIEKALFVLDPEEEILDLKKSKRSSQISEQALTTQFAEQETTKCGELFTSPDIIRQGPLQILDEETRAWKNARFVLTKAGLYWFMPENSTPCPDDYLMLARTSIEQAKAPGLKLVQEGSTLFSWRRAVILRASSIDEYCEWAIALREAIQALMGRK